MKLGMFCLCLFTVTLSLLSSAQWACCDEQPLMILNEIRAHYYEFVDHQLFFPPAHNDQSRLKRVSLGSSRSCGLPSSRFQGQSCSPGARPSIWKTYAPGYLLM